MSLCSRVRRDLPLFIGGDLDVVRSAEVGRHLRDCPACRREAVGLQQPLKHLRGIVAPAVDDSWFPAMHAAIVTRLDAEVVGGSARPWVPSGWRLGVAGAAAAVLFVVGWSWVGPATAPAALGRAPIAVPVGHSDPTRVVPYAGERGSVPLRLLGNDVVTDRGGAGIMERWALRSLVDEEFATPLPIPVPPEASTPSPRAGPK
ncbi:MAG: zf-HC2 domain-containing protein [Planctomycetes bacterium]|nr:zf-HC2 domain-containing protein [Planctomycetota bacterium]